MKKHYLLLILPLIALPILAGCACSCDRDEDRTQPQATEEKTPTTIKLLPPTKGVYHSSFPDFTNMEDQITAKRITSFEEKVNKEIVWTYFSNHWKNKIKFPKESVEIIKKQNSIPFIRMLPWETPDWTVQRDDTYSMQKIIDGKFDKDLKQWALDAKAFESSLIVEFGTEVNGDWFPWNGKFQGGATKDKYGNKKLADGPERFRDAYRHIISLFNQQEVTNITWVFHVNNWSFPEESWNTMKAYYPGDGYIDWIGISCYGAQDYEDDWESFADSFDVPYQEFIKISQNKPLALLEFGVREGPKENSKADWITAVLNAIKTNRYPRIKAISWWNDKWENEDGTVSNLKVDSSEAALKAYRDGVKDSFFVTEARFSE